MVYLSRQEYKIISCINVDKESCEEFEWNFQNILLK